MTDQTRARLTVLIPVLDEAANIAELREKLPPVLDRLDVDWRILFVDDGSTDETLHLLKQMNARDGRFTAISLSRNFGKEIAIAAGLQQITCDAAIIMDADLQHPPNVLSSFVARWREGFDIVYGQRIDRRGEGIIYRFLAHRFYKLYNALVESDIPEGAGDFRLLNRRAIDAMNTLTESSRFNKGLYSWIGFKSIGVPYTVQVRQHGATRWNPRQLLSFAIDGLTSFSTLPMRVWSLLGLAISLVALVYGIIVLTETLIYGVSVPGFPTLVVSIMFFSGAQLISLGILGEYLGRVYEEVKARPLYLVAERIGSDPVDTKSAATPPSATDRDAS